MNDILKKYIEGRDYEKITQGAVDWIRAWFAKNGPESAAVVGISGGKDSTVVAALCAKALGPENVYGIMMPNGIQPDIDDSMKLIDFLGIKSAQINIKDAYDGVINEVQNAFEVSRQTRINLAPRIRMSVLYACSQCVNGRVSNNGNRSEKYVGYSTVFGDGAGDFSPLGELTVSEVRLVGECLGLPHELVYKAPSDGLTGNTDEDVLGFTYEALDTYILTGYCPDEKLKELIDRKHEANLFKQQLMPVYHACLM